MALLSDGVVPGPLRWREGDEVEAWWRPQGQEGRWLLGTVVAHWWRHPTWAEWRFAPYQIRLADNSLIFAPRDDGSCVRKLPPNLDLLGGLPAGGDTAPNPQRADLPAPPQPPQQETLGWHQARTPEGRTYYYNPRTRATRWDDPDATLVAHLPPASGVSSETLSEQALSGQALSLEDSVGVSESAAATSAGDMGDRTVGDCGAKSEESPRELTNESRKPAKPTDAKPTDAKPTDAKPTDAKPTDAKAPLKPTLKTSAKANAKASAKANAKAKDTKENKKGGAAAMGNGSTGAAGSSGAGQQVATQSPATQPPATQQLATPATLDSRGPSKAMRALAPVLLPMLFEASRAPEQCGDGRLPDGNTFKDRLSNWIEAGGTADPIMASSGCTLLMIASSTGNIGAIRTLLEAGASVNRLSSQPLPGRSAIGFAAANGQDRVVEILIDANASVDPPAEGPKLAPKMGFSALHAASAAGHLGCVRLLIQQGARRDIVHPRTKSSPIQAAEMHGHFSVALLLAAASL